MRRACSSSIPLALAFALTVPIAFARLPRPKEWLVAHRRLTMRCLTISTLLVIALGLAGCSSKKAVDSAGTGGSANMAANPQANGQRNVVQQPIAVPASASPDQVVTA